jgi:PGF-pre-PGF domain-containing protein
LVAITHTESGKSTTQAITVNAAPIKVTSITINGAGNATAVENGKTLQMYAAVSPANAANKDISWLVINGTGKATISQTGLLTATGVGTVTVRATATDGSGVLGTLNVMVTEVPVVVTNISVKTAPTKLTYTEDEALDLQGLVIALTKSNSSTEDVAFENFNLRGIVVTPANGTVLTTTNKLVTIAHTESGKSTTQAITVNAVPVTVTEITVKTAPKKVTYTEGEALNLQGMTITFTKSNSSTEDVEFANFNSKGIVVAPANGTVLTTSNTTVTITHSESGKSTTQPITVNAVTVTGVSVKSAPAKVIYTEGDNLNLQAMVITLTRSNSATEDVAFANFNSKGIVVTPANGTVLTTTNKLVAITHTESGKSTTQAITVNAAPIKVTSITINGAGNATAVENGKTLQMYAAVSPANAANKDISWLVINGTGKATISQTGLLTATGVGTVTVRATATDGSGVLGTLNVMVTGVPVVVTNISVKTAPTKLTYTEDEALDLQGLVITLTKLNSSTEDVAFENFNLRGIVVTPANGTVLTTTNTLITISHTESGKSTTQTITVNSAQSPPPATSGGGGGGGGGSTGEKTENILLKDVSSVFVGKDAVRFDFKNPGSDIQYIEYTSLKNSGTITATIEMLKDRSTFAISSPEGTVYRHVNIWVGKTGYATEANIIDPAIVFRVDNNWISSNNIDPASINLNRYSEGAWSKLSTEQTGSDADFLYFRAATPGFSPFAITGESFENESTLHSTSETLFSTDSAENRVGALDGSSDTKANGAQAERTLPALSVTVTLIIVFFACFLLRKQ